MLLHMIVSLPDGLETVCPVVWTAAVVDRKCNKIAAVVAPDPDHAGRWQWALQPQSRRHGRTVVFEGDCATLAEAVERASRLLQAAANRPVPTKGD